MTTYTKDIVMKLVDEKGTRFATVKFIKKDGTERVVGGCLNK